LDLGRRLRPATPLEVAVPAALVEHEAALFRDRQVVGGDQAVEAERARKPRVVAADRPPDDALADEAGVEGNQLAVVAGPAADVERARRDEQAEELGSELRIQPRRMPFE